MILEIEEGMYVKQNPGARQKLEIKEIKDDQLFMRKYTRRQDDLPSLMKSNGMM